MSGKGETFVSLSRLRLSLLYCNLIPFFAFLLITISRANVSLPGSLEGFSLDLRKILTPMVLRSLLSLNYFVLMLIDIVMSYWSPRLSKEANY